MITADELRERNKAHDNATFRKLRHLEKVLTERADNGYKSCDIILDPDEVDINKVTLVLVEHGFFVKVANMRKDVLITVEW